MDRSARLHVVVISGIGGGGIRGVFAGLAKAFAELGARVTLFASPGEQHEGLRDDLENSGVAVVQDAALAMTSADMRAMSADVLFRYLTQNHDGQYTWSLLGGSIREAATFGLVKRRLLRQDIQVLTSIHLYSLRYQSRLWPLYYLVGANYYRLQVDRVFAPCEAERHKLIHSGFPSSRCSVAHLPVSSLITVIEISASPRLVTLLHRIEGKPSLVFLGNFQPSKGQADLIRMMPYLLRDYPHLMLVLAGEGPQLEPCRKLAAKLGVQDSVIFPGRLPQTDVPRLLRACAIAVVASRAETFGYCIAEPLMLGVPVVSTNVGVAGELSKIHAIRIFRNGDPADAAAKVSSYLRDPASAHHEASVGQSYISQTCTSAAVASKMLSVWQGML